MSKKPRALLTSDAKSTLDEEMKKTSDTVVRSATIEALSKGRDETNVDDINKALKGIIKPIQAPLSVKKKAALFLFSIGICEGIATLLAVIIMKILIIPIKEETSQTLAILFGPIIGGAFVSVIPFYKSLTERVTK